VKEALDAITTCCKSGDGNLLALSIEAARMRASVGEITDAMEAVSNFHKNVFCCYM
jgi:methylmalonyl-CoA mutase